jgi:catechol 2,3-dioxygenase-like lactoylglutathione lyase family enzyme
MFENTWVKKGTTPGNGGAGMIFGADPDGIQIELVEI